MEHCINFSEARLEPLTRNSILKNSLWDQSKAAVAQPCIHTMIAFLITQALALSCESMAVRCT